MYLGVSPKAAIVLILAKGCNIKGITMPIYEYSHHEGISIIGGYVYNGKSGTSVKRANIYLLIGRGLYFT